MFCQITWWYCTSSQLSPSLLFSPHRSSPLSRSWTPCSTFIVRFCVKALLRPSRCPLFPSSSWSRPRITTPPSSARTCPAPPRSAVVEHHPLVALSHAPPPVPISHREDSISSWHPPMSSTSISMLPLPHLPLASHPPPSAHHHCHITTITTTTRLRPLHLKVALMRLWVALHPSSPPTVSAVLGTGEMEGFLFWQGFHLHPLPAGAMAQAL